MSLDPKGTGAVLPDPEGTGSVPPNPEGAGAASPDGDPYRLQSLWV